MTAGSDTEATAPDGDGGALVLLSDLQQAVELLGRAIGVLVEQTPPETSDDLSPAVMVVQAGAGALRQAIERQATRGNGGDGG